jgi:two-component system, LytTR family, sensor kinase
MTQPAALDDQDIALRHFPGGRELAAIAAFWIVFGALSVTNWLFPPFGDAPPFTMRFVAVAVFGSVLWMLATPPLFWLTSRYSVERGERAATIVFYIVVGLAVAFTVDVLGELVRAALSPPFPVVPGRPPRVRPFWDLARARLLNDYTVSLAVIAAGVARDYFARYQRRHEESVRLRAQLVEARLAVLQSQLNPHFLFNTLNAVSALVERDPRGVRRMIARLSDLLRATLEPSPDPEIPVSRELEMLERYLEILRIRFQGRLETAIEASAAAADALIPPMILQPLVENAMKHAVSKTSAPSRIDVRAARAGDALVLAVQDTGPGQDGDSRNASDSGTADSTDGRGLGIGLTNTRARLTQMYGDEYSLKIDRADGGGHTVTIRLPYHTARDLRAAPTTGDVR